MYSDLQPTGWKRPIMTKETNSCSQQRVSKRGCQVGPVQRLHLPTCLEPRGSACIKSFSTCLEPRTCVPHSSTAPLIHLPGLCIANAYNEHEVTVDPAVELQLHNAKEGILIMRFLANIQIVRHPKSKFTHASDQPGACCCTDLTYTHPTSGKSDAPRKLSI